MSTTHIARAGALATLLLLTPAARAQAPLLNTFGGPQGYGTSCLGPNDDGSSERIDLTPVFPTGLQFFDRVHTSMFVNTNGNISFSAELPTYTPSAFPIANQPMIAPYWADVDIRSGAKNTETGTCGGIPSGHRTEPGACLNPNDNGVWWHLDVENRRVVVTWDRVGYFFCNTDKRMSFQLILTATEASACGTGTDFDVEFRFSECEWTTGDASGGQNGTLRVVDCQRDNRNRWYCPLRNYVPRPPGTSECSLIDGRQRCTSGVPAQAGFDAGNTMDFVEIMGSRTPEIGTLLCSGSNVTPAETGIWRFQIRSGVVQCLDAGDACTTDLLGACSAGLTYCSGAGTVCRPIVSPTEERCDNVDNDCDGSIDNGATCTHSWEECRSGICVPACFEGGCLDGQVCSNAGCIDAACENVTCTDGERCIGGNCVPACDGIVCPAGQNCSAGRCVDLCAGATCDDCLVCSAGDCVPRCQYVACPAGQACTAEGLCIEQACAGVSCAQGELCRGGACVSACDGVVCPQGEGCLLGQCVPESELPPPDAGTTTIDGGSGGIDGGALPDGGEFSLIDAGRRRPGGTSCACRSVGAPSETALAPLGIAFVALVLVRRRRRGSNGQSYGN